MRMARRRPKLAHGAAVARNLAISVRATREMLVSARRSADAPATQAERPSPQTCHETRCDSHLVRQFARVAKGVDLRSTGGNSAWVRTPQLTYLDVAHAVPNNLQQWNTRHQRIDALMRINAPACQSPATAHATRLSAGLVLV